MKLFSLFKPLLLFLLLLPIHLIWAQKTPVAYRLFDANGREISYQTLVKALALPDVVFFGEMHNCAMTHWLELKLLEDLYRIHGQDLAVGMEMFEADNQLILDEYMHGVISSDRFEAEMRLWPNYSTDYAPLVTFLKEQNVRLIATNVPRRYANVVKNRGISRFVVGRGQELSSAVADTLCCQCERNLRIRFDGTDG